jgi:hypothetical protein
MSKVKSLKEQYRATIKANGGVGYFEHQKALSISNPDIFDDANTLAVVAFQGTQDASGFLKLATDFQPELIEDAEFKEVKNPAYAVYAEHLKIFLEKHGGNPDRVTKYYTDLVYREHVTQRAENIKNAETEGKKNADEFIKNLLDVDATDNTECVTSYKNYFNSNLFEIEPAFIRAQYKKYGLTRVPVKNEAYEASILKGYAPADAYEKAILNSLAELMKLKHESSGYKGDQEVYEIFLKETLPISGTPAFKPLK